MPKFNLATVNDGEMYNNLKYFVTGYKTLAGPARSSVFAKECHIGHNVTILSNIGTREKPLEYLYLGDNVYIGENCNIGTPRLVVGDYTKIHRNCLIYGRNPLKIGYNCWFGEGTIIDCEGTTVIGNGVGAGAHSQLWSHIRHGDTLEGNQYCSFGRLTVEDDVWFVGHCIVSPIHAEAKSMAMVGSVVTRDMEANHIYGGCPAKDLTDKLGPPFGHRTVNEKYEELLERLIRFYDTHSEYAMNVVVVDAWQEELNDDPMITQFNVSTRTYKKRGTAVEQEFMKFLLPEAKFTPEGEVLP